MYCKKEKIRKYRTKPNESNDIILESNWRSFYLHSREFQGAMQMEKSRNINKKTRPKTRPDKQAKAVRLALIILTPIPSKLPLFRALSDLTKAEYDYEWNDQEPKKCSTFISKWSQTSSAIYHTAVTDQPTDQRTEPLIEVFWPT